MYLHKKRELLKDIILYTSTINTTIDFEDNIILETSLMLPSFPTITKTISNYIYEYFKYTDKDIISIYDFFPFKINCQSLERTFIDKVFATCDYYILNKSTRLSRHLYDIHMLYPMIKDFNLSLLIDEVRNLRSKIDLCPSAKQSIDINKLLKEIIDSNYYKNDYENVTLKLIYDNVSYEDVIETLKQIIATKIFI